MSGDSHQFSQIFLAKTKQRVPCRLQSDSCALAASEMHYLLMCNYSKITVISQSVAFR